MMFELQETICGVRLVLPTDGRVIYSYQGREHAGIINTVVELWSNFVM